MKPISGLLNQKIEIYRFEDIDDGAGGSIAQRVLYWATSANVMQLKAGRNLQANQERLNPVFTFEVRYRDDRFVIADMDILWRGVYYRISQAEPDFVYKQNIIITAVALDLPLR